MFENQKHWRWNKLYSGWFSWTILAKMASDTSVKLLGLSLIASTTTWWWESGYWRIVVIVSWDSTVPVTNLMDVEMDSEEEDATAHAVACWKIWMEEFRVERGPTLSVCYGRVIIIIEIGRHVLGDPVVVDWFLTSILQSWADILIHRWVILTFSVSGLSLP